MPEIQEQNKEQVSAQVDIQTTVDKKNLTPEQLKVYERIEALKKTLEAVSAQEKFSREGVDILKRGLTSDPSIKTDPEAKPTIDMYNRYLARFQEAVRKGGDIRTELASLESDVTKSTDKIEYSAGIDEKGEKLKYDTEKLKSISNREFLTLSENDRLQYVTKDNVDSDSIASGSVKDIIFSFDQDGDGQINKELYMLTTAGQVLPKEVREVTKDGQEYVRVGLKGEFFNNQNKRLTIHQDTKIDITKSGDTKEIETKNNEIYLKYISENKNTAISTSVEGKESNPELYDDLIKQSIDKGIDPKFAMFIFGDSINNMPILSIDRKTELEYLLTNYHRIRGKFPEWNGNILEESEDRDKFVLELLKDTNPSSWKEKAKEYGIKEEVVTERSKKESVSRVIDFNKLEGTNLSGIDFRLLASKYPGEASIKNNNPAGLTWNPRFASTLDRHGITYTKGTSRPSSEGGSYFGFPNMEEGLNAYNLLWDIKLSKMGNKTFGDFAKNWAVDYKSYQNTFGDHWNTKMSDLDPQLIDAIKSAQMRIESPGMHKELSKLGILTA